MPFRGDTHTCMPLFKRESPIANYRHVTTLTPALQRLTRASQLMRFLEMAQAVAYQPFAGIETLDGLDYSHFPSADWFDYSTIRAKCAALRQQFAVCAGTPGD